MGRRVAAAAAAAALLLAACQQVPEPPRRAAGPPSASPSPRSPSPSPAAVVPPVPSREPDVPEPLPPPPQSPSPAASPSLSPKTNAAPAGPGGVRCGLLSEALNHGTVVSTRVTCYPIIGRTPEKLVQQMRKKGPVVEGSRAVAATAWSLHWGYTPFQGEASCRISASNVTTRVKLVYPRWNTPQAAPEELIERWASFLTRVREHEERHKEIAVRGGRELLSGLRNLGAYPNCNALENAADKLSRGVLSDTRKRQNAFDEKESHTQASVL